MRRYIGLGITVLLGALVLFLVLKVGSFISIAVGLVVMLIPLFLYLALKKPQFYCWAFGLVLGAAPFMTLPGTGTQLVFFLAIMVAIVSLIHVRARRRGRSVSTISIWMSITIAACFISLIATYTGPQAINEWVRWALASVLAVIGVWMSPGLRLALSRAYVVGAGAGGLLGIALELFDKTGKFVSGLTFIGYGDPAGVVVRTVVVSGSTAVRATGLYVDPNTAGLFLLMALAVSAYVYRGPVRLVLMLVLAASLVATLSRSAILSVFVAAVIVLVVQNQSAVRRSVIGVLGAVTTSVVLFIPSVGGRLTGSFSSTDKGSTDRLDAFANYPGQLAGHWLFGKGWALPEFTDSTIGYLVNHVANTPLLVVYRAGLFAGLAFAALLVVGIIAAVRGLRSRDLGYGMLGAGFIGLVLIAFQLDFPVVTMPPLAMAFSIVLMNLGVASATKVDLDSDLPRASQATRHLARLGRLPEKQRAPLRQGAARPPEEVFTP